MKLFLGSLLLATGSVSSLHGATTFHGTGIVTDFSSPVGINTGDVVEFTLSYEPTALLDTEFSNSSSAIYQDGSLVTLDLAIGSGFTQMTPVPNSETTTIVVSRDPLFMAGGPFPAAFTSMFPAGAESITINAGETVGTSFGGTATSGWRFVFQDVAPNPTLADSLALPATFEELISRGTELEGIGYYLIAENSDDGLVFSGLTFDFAIQIPEPSSLSFFSLMSLGLFFRKRG